MTKVSIILPTFNEVENIVDLVMAIDRIVHDPKEIIVVDDNSPDGTSRAVESLISRGSVHGLRLITRMHDRGLTNSIREGIANASGNVIVWMDCDFSMPPELIPKLLAEVIGGHDIAVGSRFTRGGSFKRNTTGTPDSWVAVVLSRMLNMFIRILLGWSFKDYTSGFIAVRKEVLDRISLRGDYGEYFMDLIVRARLYGYSIKEIPYVCLPRMRGQSKTGANMKQYLTRGMKYVGAAFRLLVAKVEYKLFRVIDA